MDINIYTHIQIYKSTCIYINIYINDIYIYEYYTHITYLYLYIYIVIYIVYI